jgi:hypothetical protein
MTTVTNIDNKPKEKDQESELLASNNGEYVIGQSLNSYDFDPIPATILIKSKIKELKLEMPPTRSALLKLFEAMNLHIPTVRAIDCLLHCRGIRLEKSDPEDFDVNKLYQWFCRNLRTLKHISLDTVDPDWVEENKMIE